MSNERTKTAVFAAFVAFNISCYKTVAQPITADTTRKWKDEKRNVRALTLKAGTTVSLPEMPRPYVWGGDILASTWGTDHKRIGRGIEVETVDISKWNDEYRNHR